MQEIRNIAIIAHVDHGKTTIVDRMIYQARQQREQEKLGELILDNNDLERERGITILAKNVSVLYKGVKINVIDTPGHSDFGGEVERVLNMADGVILLVDAFEGCMPQTRFVLQKAIEMGKKPVLVINKVDKLNCRPDEVQEEVFDLMFALGATEDQLDFRTIYGSAKQGWMSYDWKQPTEDITALLDTILEVVPAPEVNDGTPQMLISSLEYSPYVGRIAVGRVTRGSLKAGQNITLCKRYDIQQKQKIKEIMIFDGLGKAKVDEVQCGDICAVVGLEGFEIGDTIADFENPEALPPIEVDEPTMSMLFCINNSPFFGKEGKFVTSRHLRHMPRLRFSWRSMSICCLVWQVCGPTLSVSEEVRVHVVVPVSVRSRPTAVSCVTASQNLRRSSRRSTVRWLCSVQIVVRWCAWRWSATRMSANRP